ncbi:hypothetical protein NVP1015O_08 [Vibrio phage 1.015.O._10N.222.51.E5]|nr:hypothetical protein NVP1015O_08 [Vibrio phage 1.015.O._10N.222.51.E5]
MKMTADMIREIKDGLLEGIHPLPEELQGCTQALFYEYRHDCKGKTPYYNLSEFDKNGTVSMYQIFMQCPSEYDAALVLVGSWKHWCRITETKWFKPYITKWRQDMDVRNNAIAQSTIFTKALNGDVQASKELTKGTSIRGENKSTGRKPKPTRDVNSSDVDAFMKAGTEAMNEQRKREH